MRGDAAAISGAFWKAGAVSVGTIISRPSAPPTYSACSSSASKRWTSAAASILGGKMPSSPGLTTAARSEPVVRVAKPLGLTNSPMSWPSARTRSIDAATMLRAATLSASGTASSRSSTMASAPEAMPLATSSGRCPGMNSSDRYGFIDSLPP